MAKKYEWNEWDAYRTIDTESEMRNYLSQFNMYLARSVVKERPEYRIIAVQMHPHALKACPKSDQSFELVKTALKNDGSSIRFASKKFSRLIQNFTELQCGIMAWP